MDIPPNKTLYVRNVSDKLKKEPLKKHLYMAFSAYGRVIDIVACKGEQKRGQAWVVYDDVGSATTALRSLQGFPFFGKTLRIQFAKTKSDAVAIREGVYEPRAKRQKREEKEKARAAAARAAAGGGGGGGGGADGRRERDREEERKGEKEKAPAETSGEVSSMLMAQELPAEVTEQMLGVLFGRFAGLVEIRMAGQRGIAFIEFRDEVSARTAYQAYNGFKLSNTDALKLKYAKR